MQEFRGVGCTVGFSLIELLTVLILVAVLALVAMPVYQRHVLAMGRLQAVAMLLQVSLRQQGYLATHYRYADNLAALGYPDDSFSITRSGRINEGAAADGIYQIQMSTVDERYTITATPENGQASDARCAALSLSSRGRAGVSGSGSIHECWRSRS